MVTAFVGGLLSSAHCIGMCGGFAALVGATGSGLRRSLARQLPYSLGRITTYAFFGALGGFAGLHLAQVDSSTVAVQRILSISTGVLMALIGVWMLLPIRWRAATGIGPAALFVPMFSHFLKLRAHGGLFLAGLANGFLPCGLVYAFLVKAVATSNAVDGTLVMIAFGSGTVPAMVAVGCGASLAGHRLRRHAHRLAACLIIAMGAVTIQRAVAIGSSGSCH